MASQAEKRRKKQHARAIKATAGFDLAPVPRREDNGRPTRQGIARDPSIETLLVRCRQMGKEPTRAAIRGMRAPWNGCNAGQAMARAVQGEHERLELWGAITHMRTVQASYDAAIGAPHRHAVCLRLLLPLEALEADATTPPKDERSDDERQRDAVNALMKMEGWLGYTDSAAASQAKRSVIDDEPVH